MMFLLPATHSFIDVILDLTQLVLVDELLSSHCFFVCLFGRFMSISIKTTLELSLRISQTKFRCYCLVYLFVAVLNMLEVLDRKELIYKMN